MRIVLVILFAFLMTGVTVEAQIYPTTLPSIDTELTRQLEWRLIRRHLDGLDNLQKIPDGAPRSKEANDGSILDAVYRRSTKSERELLAPTNEDRSKYADFLKQPGTGIFRLIRDFGCDDYSATVRNDKICEKFSMPGGGAAFSFRQEDYQFWKLSDLLYDGKSFLALGQMSIGFLVDVGDMPLESMQADSKGVKYIMSFEPSSDIATATKQNTQMADGIEDGGYFYKKFLPAIAGHTYAIRSVAYRGKVPSEYSEIKYNELDFDRRRDIVAAFRVVQMDFNGTVTIIWKTLQVRQSPELRTTK